MERITMSLDEDLARQFDALIAKRGYASRSEAMRDLLRREVEGSRIQYERHAHCVANLSYAYNHRLRDLALRLSESQHAHHDLVVATTYVRLDHEHCLESVMLKGATSAVRGFADSVQAERGVAHGQLNMITVETGDRHMPAGAHHHRGHMLPVPRS